MGITAHWIDNNWQMNDCVLDFLNVSEMTHTGANLANAVAQLMEDLGLENKILAIVTDNASNNNTLMENLSPDIKHVRCFGHVLNLAVQGIYFYCLI